MVKSWEVFYKNLCYDGIIKSCSIRAALLSCPEVSAVEDFKMVQYMTCTECVKKLNSLDNQKQSFLRQRSGLARCQGCERLAEIKPKDR